jgi:two-component sensor histidine kinase
MNARLHGIEEGPRGELILATHELVTNVIKHGRPRTDEEMTVSLLSLDHCVRVEVCGEGEGFDPNESPPGWGLYLLSRIASRWGAKGRGRVWCVWFEKDLDPAATG